jgi:[acyl-carrier-protein] S-malonyltransferase
MLQALSSAHPQVRETFDEASQHLGLDLWTLASEGPKEALDRTENTQPVMLCAGVAVWRVWRSQGGCLPQMMAGHSLGEYSALVCAGALDFGDAITLVRERARLMQSAVPPGEGAMAAILGLDDAQVRALCAQAAGDRVVAAVNFNSPGQVVIAGHSDAVERAMALAREGGARRVLRLDVSVPAHSPLMHPAVARLTQRLAQVPFRAPGIPVLHNADVASHAEPDAIRDALARQLHSPVRWVETIGQMVDKGVMDILELGPGKVLTGLNRRIERKLRGLCIQDPQGLEQALTRCEEV